MAGTKQVISLAVSVSYPSSSGSRYIRYPYCLQELRLAQCLCTQLGPLITIDLGSSSPKIPLASMVREEGSLNVPDGWMLPTCRSWYIGPWYPRFLGIFPLILLLDALVSLIFSDTLSDKHSLPSTGVSCLK